MRGATFNSSSATPTVVQVNRGRDMVNETGEMGEGRGIGRARGEGSKGKDLYTNQPSLLHV